MKHKNKRITPKKHLLVLAIGLLFASLLFAGCSIPDFFASSDGSPSGPQSVSEPQSEPQSQPQPVQPSAEAGLTLPAEGISALTGQEGNFHRRPIAVMLYNASNAFPQWGIASADIFIEALTEGTSTRAMTITSDYERVEKLGPVGPARDIFLQFGMPFAAVPMFVNSDIYASNLLNLHGYQPLDGMYVGTISFDLDYERDKTYPQELCWYTNAGLIANGLESYGQSTDADTPTFFNFQPDSTPKNSAGARLDIGYSQDRTATLEYQEGRYLLKHWDDPQLDASREDGLNGYQNVILLMARSGKKDDGVTWDYDLTSGEGLYLSGGGAVKIQWQKGDPTSSLRLFDEQGNPLAVEPGRSYIGIWGGFEGQSLRLLDADGTEQPLPQTPEALPDRQPPQPEETPEEAPVDEGTEPTE